MLCASETREFKQESIRLQQKEKVLTTEIKAWTEAHDATIEATVKAALASSIEVPPDLTLARSWFGQQQALLKSGMKELHGFIDKDSDGQISEDEARVHFERVEDNINVLQSHIQTEFYSLAAQEKLLSQDLALFEERLRAWGKEEHDAASRSSAGPLPSVARKRANDVKRPPEVDAYEALRSGKATASAIKRCAEVLCMDEDQVDAHWKWFSELEQLREQRRDAIQRWRETKGSMGKPQLLDEAAESANAAPPRRQAPELTVDDRLAKLAQIEQWRAQKLQRKEERRRAEIEGRQLELAKQREREITRREKSKAAIAQFKERRDRTKANEEQRVQLHLEKVGPQKEDLERIRVKNEQLLQRRIELCRQKTASANEDKVATRIKEKHALGQSHNLASPAHAGDQRVSPAPAAQVPAPEGSPSQGSGIPSVSGHSESPASDSKVTGSHHTLPDQTHLVEENRKLRDEVEILSEQRNQNGLLKETIQSLTAEAEKLRKELNDVKSELQQKNSEAQLLAEVMQETKNHPLPPAMEPQRETALLSQLRPSTIVSKANESPKDAADVDPNQAAAESDKKPPDAENAPAIPTGPAPAGGELSAEASALIDQLNAQINSMKAQAATLQAALAAAVHRATRAEEQASVRQSDMTRVLEKLTANEGALHDLRTKLEKAQAELAAAQQNVAKLEKERTAANDQVKSLTANGLALQARIDQAEASKLALSRNTEITKKEIESVKAQLAAAQQGVKDAEAREVATRKDLESARAAVAAAEASAKTEAAAMASLKKELDTAIGAKNQAQTLASDATAAKGDLEVLRSSHNRLSLRIQELEVELKQLRSSEAALKRNVTELELDHADLKSKADALQSEAEKVRAKNETLTLEIESKTKTLDETSAANTALQTDVSTLRADKEDLETSIRVMERKSGQIVKDLQKQLKDRRRDDGASEPSPMGLDSTMRSPFTGSNTNLLNSANSGPSVDATEFAALQDKVAKLNAELDAKSKMLQQYIMKEHQAVIERSLNQSKGRAGLSLAALSSQSSLQKMDHGLLVEINMKLQTILEEQTLKAVQLQDDVARLHAELSKSHQPRGEPTQKAAAQ